VRLTEVLNFRSLQGHATLTEKEDALRELTSALLSGRSDEAKQKAYAALAKGNNERDVLDTIVEAVNIISDLQGLGQYDQAKSTSLESAINAGLLSLEPWLLKSEGRFGVRVTVGPVGLTSGALLGLALSASLRSIGFRATNLKKTQTALDLLRNSEELGSDLVIPILPDDEQLRSFADAYERGGFRNKFEVIPIASKLSENVGVDMNSARNPEEAISKATQWALRNKK